MDLFLNRNIAGVEPTAWNAIPNSSLKALDENSMRDAVKGMLVSSACDGLQLATGECGIRNGSRKTDRRSD